jgi:hypothetical protein
MDPVSVQYFAGSNSIAIVTNVGFFDPASYFLWENVPAGSYSLTAVVTARAGLTATSAPVNISVTNVPLAIKLEYPTNGQVFTALANIGINSHVSDSAAVQLVKYFANASPIGTVSNLSGSNSTASFFLNWTNVSSGNYILTAVAQDSSGNSATSAPVNITVTNVPVTISLISPTNGESFGAPATVFLAAKVNPISAVKFVQFFSGSNSIGVATNPIAIDPLPGSPIFGVLYIFNWTNVPQGNYTLTAVATTAGSTATSGPVNITVTNTPFTVQITAPTNGQSFAAPALVEINAQTTDSAPVRSVQFFAGTNSLGIVSNTFNPEQSFYFLWDAAQSGKFALTAIATDTAGRTATSAPVNITVTNNPLTISIQQPTNGSSFGAPANIGIYSSVGGSLPVQTVQYFAGTNSLGIVSNGIIFLPLTPTPLPIDPPIIPWPPVNESFYLYWTNVPAGSYALTAVATDSMGNMATSAPVNITVTNVPLSITLTYPTNGSAYSAPANVYIDASVSPLAGVKSVQFFSGGTNIGVVSNGVIVVDPPIIPAPTPYPGELFVLDWTNVGAGTYTITAVAKTSSGIMATSAPITITVTNIPFSVAITSPKDGQSFIAPATVTLTSHATDLSPVKTVQYFNGKVSLGTVSNSSATAAFSFSWSNVTSGKYIITAIATDAGGNTATSAPVNITVTNLPFLVSFYYPSNGQTYVAPASIGLHARVTDSQVVRTVEYLNGTNAIATVTNTNNVVITNPDLGNPFFYNWTNVPVGSYVLTAVAVDATGIMATSAPITVYVVSNLPPVVRIFAPDPIAIAGTNGGSLGTPPFTNSLGGTNTATFLVQRSGQTNNDLLVFLAIGGTASNGVDYTAISNTAIIPAGQSYTLIPIVPLTGMAAADIYKTVILTVIPSPAASPLPTYSIGIPSSAEAIILENFLRPGRPVLRVLSDNTIHLSVPVSDGASYSVQTSSDLLNWISVCTNTAVNGSVQFADPSGASPSQFYRVVPVNGPPNY